MIIKKLGIIQYICLILSKGKKMKPTYHILLFGICRDLLKSSTISIEKEGNVTVEEMLQSLRMLHPALEKLPSLRLAAEHRFPAPDFILSTGMEIALIPPVSGG